MTVLMVEDDAALRTPLVAVLRRNGVATSLLVRGDDALTEILRAGPRYAAIVVDLMLPGLSGLAVLDYLRSVSPVLLSRIIVLGEVSAGMPGRLDAKEVWSVLRKPFDLGEFRERVLACISAHAGPSPLARQHFSRWLECRSFALGARAGIVTCSSDERLDVRAHFGFDAGAFDDHFPLRAGKKSLITAAFRLTRPVYVGSVSAVKTEQYPLLLPVWIDRGIEAVAAIPLFDGREPVGAAGWSFAEPQAFHDAQKERLEAIAGEAARILRRADAAPALPEAAP